MSYNIDYDEAGFIKLIYEGDADLQEVKEVISRGVAIAIERNCFRVLSDFRSMNLNLTTADIFSIPLKQIIQSRELNVPYYKFRRAMVVPDTDFEKYKFFENVAVNRSHVIKIFTDYNMATTWLLSGAKKQAIQAKDEYVSSYNQADNQ